MAKKTKKKESTQVKEQVVKLACKLSVEEVVEKAGALAAIVMAVASENQNLDAEKAAFKERKDEIEFAIASYRVKESELSESIARGDEMRDVKCEATFDYEAGTVTVRRLDTGEVFEDREMNDLEKQMELEFDKDNPKETSATVPCNDCKGTGIDENNCRCEACRGAGEIEVSVTEPEGETK